MYIILLKLILNNQKIDISSNNQNNNNNTQNINISLKQSK